MRASSQSKMSRSGYSSQGSSLVQFIRSWKVLMWRGLEARLDRYLETPVRRSVSKTTVALPVAQDAKSSADAFRKEKSVGSTMVAPAEERMWRESLKVWRVWSLL